MFKFEKSGNVGILNCEGTLSADRAGELKDALMVCIENSDHVVVDCKKVRSIDTQCVQIFCVAHRISVRANKKFSVAGMRSDIFSASDEEINFICASRSSLGCNKTCLWVARDVPACT